MLRPVAPPRRNRGAAKEGARGNRPAHNPEANPMGGGWLGRKVADGATAAVVSEDSEGFSWRMCDDFERELRTETVRVTELKGEAETKESRLARIDKENDAKRQVLREIAECIAERKRSNADRAAETNEWQQQCDEFERARASDEADYDRMMGERRELKLAIDELSVQERDPLGELEACYVKLNRAQADLRAATAKREETEARRAELDRETARLIEERRAILRALQETFGASAAEYEAEVARGEWLQSQITSVRGILDGEHEKKALEAEPKPEPTRAIRVSHAGSNESDEWRDAPIPPRKTVLDHRPGNFRHPGGEFMHMRGRRQVDTPKVSHLFRRGRVKCDEVRLHLQGSKKEHTMVKGKVVKSITGQGASVTFYDAEHRCVDPNMIMFSKRATKTADTQNRRGWKERLSGRHRATPLEI